MTIPKELIRLIRGLDTYDLRRLRILIDGLLIGHDRTDEDAPSSPTFRQEYVRCGKGSCTRCPHGPYWYAYWREGGRVRSRYIGKQLPAAD